MDPVVVHEMRLVPSSIMSSLKTFTAFRQYHAVARRTRKGGEDERLTLTPGLRLEPRSAILIRLGISRAPRVEGFAVYGGFLPRKCRVWPGWSPESERVLGFGCSRLLGIRFGNLKMCRLVDDSQLA